MPTSKSKVAQPLAAAEKTSPKTTLRSLRDRLQQIVDRAQQQGEKYLESARKLVPAKISLEQLQTEAETVLKAARTDYEQTVKTLQTLQDKSALKRFVQSKLNAAPVASRAAAKKTVAKTTSKRIAR